MKRLMLALVVPMLALGFAACRPKLAAPKPIKLEATVAEPCPTGPTLTAIPAIQGAGMTSSLDGQTVTVEGIVTGDFQPPGKMDGFFLQAREGDGDPATSDGLFVYLPVSNPGSSIDVAPGDLVRVSGTVKEFRTGSDTLTELTSVSALIVCASGLAAQPTPVELPLENGANLERYEGMLVTFPQALTVTEVYDLGRRGEILLSSGGRLFTPTDGHGGSQEDVARRSIVLDDASSKQNPVPIPFLSGPGADGTRRTGDTVAGLTGVLSFGFGKYRVLPTAEPAFKESNPRTTEPQPIAGSLKVASFNVLNYFTTLGKRGANSPEELERQQAKIVAALKALDADVVGLIEMESNGPTAINHLVGALNAAYGAKDNRPVYAVVADPAEGVGADVIKVAFIYKPQSVSLVGKAVSLASPVFDRYPVAQTFRKGKGSGRKGPDFTVVINHFKSKGSCPSSGDVDQGQGCWNLKRTEQANLLLQLVGQLRKRDPDVLVIGDLNAYTEEDPVRALVAGGLKNLSLGEPADHRYSYVFGGQSGQLDHALATPSMAEQVQGLTHWHINADEPPVLDYNTENKPDDRYAPTPFRSSDHDPVLIGLNPNAR